MSKLDDIRAKMNKVHEMVPNTTIPTVSLSMIVKNEEKVIERLLKTVTKLIDYYVIVDTGSTDKTKEIIDNFFKENNIKGEIIDHEWVNFETARNCALEHTKGKADFGFWIDADEQILYDDDFNPAKFKLNLAAVDMASIEVKYGGTKYTRTQLWRTSKPFKWRGPVHEILMCEEKDIRHGIVRIPYVSKT